MRLSFLNIFFTATFLLLCSVLIVSCDKVDVTFYNLNQSGDPDVIYYQNYKVAMQTMQLDSFPTSGQNTFTLGYYNDPLFGTIHASSYAQFQLPAANPLLNQKFVTFDSLEIVFKSKANYYGDTTQKFYFKINPLTELIQNTEVNNNSYYNTRSFGFDADSQLVYWPGEYIIDTPGIATPLPKSIRLSDALGKDFFSKLQTGDYTISNQTTFLNYFKGLYIDVDTAQMKLLYSFMNDSLTLRLDYDVHGITTVKQHVDFSLITDKQFNHIDYNKGALFPSFPSPVNNVSLLSSTVTGDKSYLNSTTGTYIKLSFPDLLNLKALHPYVKVVAAQLIIPPTPGTYNYPYVLPPALYLYETSVLNTLLGLAPSLTGGGQNGNLFIDRLSGLNTQYTYDITNFVSSILNPPVNPTSTTPNALILTTSSSLGDQSLSRLVVNDQTLINGIQLKLYVLGI